MFHIFYLYQTNKKLEDLLLTQAVIFLKSISYLHNRLFCVKFIYLFQMTWKMIQMWCDVGNSRSWVSYPRPAWAWVTPEPREPPLVCTMIRWVLGVSIVWCRLLKDSGRIWGELDWALGQFETVAPQAIGWGNHIVVWYKLSIWSLS